MKYLLFLISPLLIYSGNAIAHGKRIHNTKPAFDYSQAEEKPFGKAADPQHARHTITVDMSDEMRFTPAEITVKRGDIVRFVIRNKGKLLHEMVLGSENDLKEHSEMMKKFPGMEHDEPYMAHVSPGKTGEIGWQFTQSGVFQYGCLLPGHFEAGMKGRLVVEP